PTSSSSLSLHDALPIYVIVLAEGDRVAADAVLRQCDDLLTDESLLTGESVPVRKRPAADAAIDVAATAGGDDQPFVFSGSLVVRSEEHTSELQSLRHLV